MRLSSIDLSSDPNLSSLSHLSPLTHPRRVQLQLSNSTWGMGAMHQALCAALANECKEYYRFMALLQSKASEPTAQEEEGELGGATLTLRRLAVWLGEPIRRMRLLAALADSTSGLRGGALVSAVHAHVHSHG